MECLAHRHAQAKRGGWRLFKRYNENWLQTCSPKKRRPQKTFRRFQNRIKDTIC